MLKRVFVIFYLSFSLLSYLYSQSFNCDGKIYFFRWDNGDNYLSYVDGYTTPNPVLVNVCNLTQMGIVNQNALAANPFDNYLYFMTLSNFNLYRIDASCNTTLVCPSVANSHRGCFDHLGRYWVIVGSDLQAYDINTCTMVKGPFPLALTPGADITYSLADCHFYMSSENQLIKIDTNGNIVYTNNLGFGAGTGYGGIGIGVDGNLYGMPNVYDTLILYKVDLNTMAPVGVAASFSSSVANPCGCDMATFPCPVLNAEFTATPTEACNPVVVQFTNHSSGLVNSWLWDFGDGSIDTVSINPEHLYTQAGVYQVSLIVYAYSNCIYIKPDTFNLNITVFSLPEADFSYSTPCVNTPIYFSDSSSNDVVSWFWNFGDGSSSSQQNPIHTYNQNGNFNVSLIVQNNNGCKDTIIKSIIVNPLPSPAFTCQPVCLEQISFFYDNSTTANNSSLISWAWQFDSQNTSNIQHPNFTFNSDGAHQVTLIVENSFGCFDTITQYITVYPKPIADFIFTNQCDGIAITFSDNSTVTSGNYIDSTAWNFGDGNSDTGSQTTHLYDTSGVYLTSLIVTSQQGCKDTIEKNVEVYSIPTASFVFSDICINNTASFFNLSTAASGDSIIMNIWNTGNLSPIQYQQNAISFYNQEGLYNIQLKVTTNHNCSDSLTQILTVYDAPQSSFTAQNVCIYDTVSFTNTTINPSFGNIGQHYWHYGDNSPADSLNWHTTHQYALNGIYDACLITLNSILSCADTTCLTVEIYPTPVAQFSYVNACLNDSVIFNDLSAGNILHYDWDFGDNSPHDSTQHTHHVYASSGNYNAWLIVTDSNNCVDSVRHNVSTYPLPVADFNYSDVCLDFTAIFTDISTIAPPDMINQWQWSFGDNSLLSSTQNTSHQYSQANQYTVQLIVTTSLNCKDTIEKIIKVHPLPLVDFEAEREGCAVFCPQFTDLSLITTGNISQWYWSCSNGINAQSENPIICFENTSSNPIFYDIALTVISDMGCQASLSKPEYITVFPIPIAGFDVFPAKTNILEPLIRFFDKSQYTISWYWNFGDNTGNSTEQNPEYIYQDTGHFNIMQIVENIYNCFDTAYGIVYIEPNWALYIPNSFTPNSDGLNDIFMASGYGISEFEIYVFSRWGQIVFYSDDMNKGWDGCVKDGKSELIVPQAVFAYKVNFTTITGRKLIRYGHVTVLGSETY